MDNFTIEVSNTGIIKFIFFGTALFLILFVLRKIIHLFPIDKKIKDLTRRYFPFIEILVWCAFLVWSVTTILKGNLVYSGIILLLIIIVLVLLSILLFKDIIAGIVLKTENSISIGDILQINDYSGKVTKTGYRSIEIETDLGIVIRIPYSKISDDSIIKLNPAEIARKSQSIKVTVSKKHGEVEIIDRIKRIVLNSPFVSLTKEPNVQKDSETETEFVFNVSVFTMDTKYIPTIKEYLNNELSNMT